MTAPAKPPRFTDSLANLIGEAVGDIREKLVEEAWFGRPTAPRPGFDEMTRALYGQSADHAPARETPFKSPDIDMDR